MRSLLLKSSASSSIPVTDTALRRNDVAPADVLLPHPAQVDCGPLSGYRLLASFRAVWFADLRRNTYFGNVDLIVQGTGSSG